MCGNKLDNGWQMILYLIIEDKVISSILNKYISIIANNPLANNVFVILFMAFISQTKKQCIFV